MQNEFTTTRQNSFVLNALRNPRGMLVVKPALFGESLNKARGESVERRLNALKQAPFMPKTKLFLGPKPALAPFFSLGGTTHRHFLEKKNVFPLCS